MDCILLSCLCSSTGRMNYASVIGTLSLAGLQRLMVQRCSDADASIYAIVRCHIPHSLIFGVIVHISVVGQVTD